MAALPLDNSDHCLKEIREANPGVYSAILFQPAHNRPAAAALHGFHLEVARITANASDPMPGEIRLQWWLEVINRERDGEACASPLASSLLAVIAKYKLPVEGFERYLEARRFDLYNDPMPDRTTLEAYLGETESFVLQMNAILAGAKSTTDLANACGHGGVAIGMAKIVSRLTRDRGMQRVYFPVDLLSAAGLDVKRWLSADSADVKARAAVDMFIALAAQHCEKASTAIRRLPKELQSVFLPLAPARKLLKKARKTNDHTVGDIRLSPLSVQLSLWKAVLTGL